MAARQITGYKILPDLFIAAAARKTPRQSSPPGSPVCAAAVRVRLAGAKKIRLIEPDFLKTGGRKTNLTYESLRSKRQKFFNFDAFLISKKCSPKFSVKQKNLVGC